MKIGLIVNFEKKDAVECAGKIIDFLREKGQQVIIPQSYKAVFENKNVLCCKDDCELFSLCDFAVTVGGDGTIIHNAKHAAAAHKPLIGINLGRIGFVANLEPYEIEELSKILDGNYKIEKRMLLEVTINGGKESKKFTAVNDVNISRGTLSGIADINVYLNNEKFTSYRADGIIVATPTGSTAYSFSAGGPVLEPVMKCILLTPVCPHSLTLRSVIFDEESKISVDADNGRECYLIIDGQTSIKLSPGDIVTIKKSPLELELINIKGKNFYRLLNEKLKESN